MPPLTISCCALLLPQATGLTCLAQPPVRSHGPCVPCDVSKSTRRLATACRPRLITACILPVFSVVRFSRAKTVVKVCGTLKNMKRLVDRRVLFIWRAWRLYLERAGGPYPAAAIRPPPVWVRRRNHLPGRLRLQLPISLKPAAADQNTSSNRSSNCSSNPSHSTGSHS